jgi:hypothetical protein
MRSASSIPKPPTEVSFSPGTTYRRWVVVEFKAGTLRAKQNADSPSLPIADSATRARDRAIALAGRIGGRRRVVP